MQDVFLFSGSLRENVCLHDDSLTDEHIWEAIRAVGAEAFVERLPDGLDHDVRERGATLSVGQRQLIAFVRACEQPQHLDFGRSDVKHRQRKRTLDSGGHGETHRGKDVVAGGAPTQHGA